ncbi:hypothetical protein OBBRIDRAFT_891404 [Obba rivulosa]|uniref:F-box domain-containing protein n=1 Tax=Obba rivulosa TaxID=1052685 RepID=A0A8E2AIH2_9APHY|nr:hypothetical protein OBBRIDRAFT_891404 [Obba rivulosa]
MVWFDWTLAHTLYRYLSPRLPLWLRGPFKVLLAEKVLADMAIDPVNQPGPQGIAAAETESWTQPVLNFDILDLSMSFLHTRDLLAVMRTCRALHSTGFRHLLAHGHSLHNWKKTKAFCEFVLADTPGRCNLIRDLDLKVRDEWKDDYPSNVISLLAKVLVNSRHISRLAISIGKKQYEEHPELGAALNALESLKTLAIYHGTEADGELLKGLKLPLTELNADFDEVMSSDVATNVLHNFVNSLETLSSKGLPLQAWSTSPFSRVRGLHFMFINRNYNTSILIDMFPHITHLSLEENYGMYSWGEIAIDDEVERGRALNQRNVKSSWTSLESVSGDFVSIYAAAITSKVHHLDTLIYNSDGNHLRAVINDMRPDELVLSIQSEKDNHNRNEEIDRVPVNGQPMKLLQAISQVPDATIYFDVDKWYDWNAIFVSFAALSIHFRT